MQHLLPVRFRGWAAALATILWAGAATPGEATAPTAPDTHWAFAPLSRAEPPRPRAAAWARTVPDLWVLEGLERAGLEPSPEADRISWLRRVHFDLTGLPPTPEAVEAFGRDSRPDAHERVVEALLQSPAHGERWGQHWLDVVRYADTHGFEVNTERPHAWPYRDYVIRAFNADTPFPEFIREQLAGDQIGRDAATGFLVTASVLLPGQIGADDVSKRLARQDALDEIVVNTSQAFLGLTVGCARCHDHKFDPVSSRDYFGMQAFFAGVEYGDRELKDPESEARREDIRRWKQRKALVESELSRIEPEARPASPSGSAPGRPAVRARGNSDRFPPVTTRRVRFTVLETNSLEPCIDELEVWDPEARNVALATTGTTVRSSGDTTVENRHELRFIHDGVHGNAHSWMSNEKGRGWVILEFPEPRRIDRVTWARDREGEFSDRLATAYRIEVGTDSGGWMTVADASDRKPFEGRNPTSDEWQVPLDGLPPHARDRARSLRDEHLGLERAIAGAVASQQAFAGLFRKPDRIHLLRRGDPEQRIYPTCRKALQMRKDNKYGNINWADMYKSMEGEMMDIREQLRFWKKCSDRLAMSSTDDIAVMQYYEGAESVMKRYSDGETIANCTECSMEHELCYKHLKVRYDYLRYLVRDVVEAINIAGPNPDRHFRVMRKHRKQWPFLWKRVDRLREWSNRHS